MAPGAAAAIQVLRPTKLSVSAYRLRSELETRELKNGLDRIEQVELPVAAGAVGAVPAEEAVDRAVYVVEQVVARAAADAVGAGAAVELVVAVAALDRVV